MADGTLNPFHSLAINESNTSLSPVCLEVAVDIHLQSAAVCLQVIAIFGIGRIRMKWGCLKLAENAHFRT